MLLMEVKVHSASYVQLHHINDALAGDPACSQLSASTDQKNILARANSVFGHITGLMSEAVQAE